MVGGPALQSLPTPQSLPTLRSQRHRYQAGVHDVVMSSTVLRTSTAVVGGHSLLAGRTTERLTTAAVGVRRIGLHEPDSGPE